MKTTELAKIRKKSEDKRTYEEKRALEIVKELYQELAKQLKEIDDPWYQQKILSDILPY